LTIFAHEAGEEIRTLGLNLGKERVFNLKIEKLKVEDKDKCYHDSIESGLILIIQPSVAKTFWLRYYANGREIKFHIGDFKDISIQNARKQAVSQKK
jgi:hypothetical protein